MKRSMNWIKQKTKQVLFKYWPYIFLGLLAGVLLVLKLAKPFEHKYTVTKTLPSHQANLVELDSNIQIWFENSVELEKISVEVFPELEYQLSQPSSKSILIAPKYFLDNKTPYKVSLSANDKSFFQLGFTTKETQGNPSVIKKATEWEQVNYPLSDHTPYTNQDFTVEYLDKLSLRATIKTKPIDKSKNQVLSWIKSHGIDPSTHQIKWVINPSLDNQ